MYNAAADAIDKQAFQDRMRGIYDKSASDEVQRSLVERIRQAQ